MTTTTKPIRADFYTNGTASHCWRIDGVADWLNFYTEEHAVYVAEWTKWKGKPGEDANLVIIEMLTSEDMVKDCHAHGAKVIYETDDAMIDSYGDERGNLQKVGGEFRDASIRTINSCDAMIVTTERLKKSYEGTITIPIYVIPNYVDFNWYGKGKLNIERTTDEVRIGWFGSRGHLEDLKMVTPAICEVLDKYPQAKFVYAGFGGMSSDSVATEATWGEDVLKDIPRERREFVVGVREDVWPMKHRTLDLDIGIAPLIDDTFNWCKTPIKWMEYGLLGTPMVCSPTLYSEYVKDGENALIANNHKEWVKHLSALIEDAALRKKIGEAARAEAENNWDLEDHKEEFLKVFQEVVYGKN
jgi:glycosyltransferase involved in cell wall biosynthesis